MTGPLAGKNVLYAITKSNWGGAQTYVYTLAKGAREAGAQVSVMAGSADGKGGDSGRLFEMLQEAGIPTIRLSSIMRDISIIAEIKAFVELVRILRRERPDVLHLNSSKMGILGSVAGRLAGVPRIVFTAHGWAFNESRPFWQKLLFLKIHALTIYLSSYTICVSEAVRRDMAWLPFSKKKMAVIRNGIDPFPLLERERARKALTPFVPLNPEAVWLGMVSELHPTKRVDVAIRSLAALVPTHPNLQIVVLGEGEARTALEALIKELGMTDHVQLCGFIPEARTYLPAFDIFLLPSQTEALGYVLLEAGFASLPVIASDVGGIPEIIENEVSGVLIPPNDPRLLTSAILRLLEDKEYATFLRVNLHRRVLEYFISDRMVAETIARY